MNIPQLLWLLGSVTITMLAGLHLYFTFFTNKFSARNGQLERDMQSSYPILTRKTTMWKAWIGFNGSHSSGGIFIGVINGYLALRYFDILQTDHFYFLFNILTIGFYVWLARRYWFNIPLAGLTLTLGCYMAAYLTVIR